MTVAAHQWWPAPLASGPIDATVTVPGSKSQTNRALVLAAIAEGPSRLRGALDSRDTRLMVAGLRSLGMGFTIDHPTGDLLITPIDQIRTGATIDCGLAGTVLRFLPALAACGAGTTHFIGDEAAMVRPVGPLLTALEAMGARVYYEGEAGYLPFSITGVHHLPAPGAPTRIEVNGATSSQYLSALLLASPLMNGPVTLVATGPTVSWPHVEMTIDELAARGVPVTTPGPALVNDDARELHLAPTRPRAGTWTLEPDLSNAGVFLAAAMLTGGAVTIPGWPTHTTQAGAAWGDLLTRMGAQSSLDSSGLHLHGPGAYAYPGIDADLSATGELAPTLAALCLFATSPSRLSGIAHLRGHETDRLAALVAEISRLGAHAVESPDGLTITPAPLHPARLLAYDDHRLATFGAIVGLVVPGVEVDDIASTSKTLPNFTHLWNAMLSGDGAAS